MKATFAASPSPADRIKMFERTYSIFVRNSNEIFDLRRFVFHVLWKTRRPEKPTAGRKVARTSKSSGTQENAPGPPSPFRPFPFIPTQFPPPPPTRDPHPSSLP